VHVLQLRLERRRALERRVALLQRLRAALLRGAAAVGLRRGARRQLRQPRLQHRHPARGASRRRRRHGGGGAERTVLLRRRRAAPARRKQLFRRDHPSAQRALRRATAAGSA
jgi:hypothetical protein